MVPTLPGWRRGTANPSAFATGCLGLKDSFGSILRSQGGQVTKLITALTACLLISGCASVPTGQTVFVNGKFDVADVTAKMQPGTAKLSGTAFLRQRGGGVVTCAGQEVVLLPVTDYATDRLNHIYHSAPRTGTTAYADYYSPRHRDRFSPDLPEYQELVHKTLCDAQGNFEFKNIQYGRYYITTGVIWQVGYATHGGALATQVHVNSDDVQRVILSK